MPNFSIGLSALQSSQYALDVISGNVANANTPGYHRQNVHLQTLPGNQIGRHQFGSGVQIQYIERIRSSVTETALTNSISDAQNIDQLLTVERQLEYIFHPGEGSINQRLDSLFGELTKLSSTPSEPTQRAVVVEQAGRIADSFRQMNDQLFELRSAVRYQIEQEINSLNTNMASLTEISIQIDIASVTTDPNRQLDDRDALINEIAKSIDVSRQEYANDGLNLAFGGSVVQLGVSPIEFQAVQNEGETLGITIGGDEHPISFASGKLPALLELYNEIIPEFSSRLDELANGLIQEFDRAHAAGVGINGSFSSLLANRSVEDTQVPLAEAGAAFPIENGELYFSILDADGNRTTQSISIDPETDSLEDVANAISQLDRLNASVNPETKKLKIFAQPGYTFDFTGTTESHPDLTNYSGTSVPAFSGSYEGNTNGTYSFQIEGSGNVGVSDNLYVNVFDNEGAQISRLNIGNGYEAGSELEIAQGVSLSFPGGTVADGDSFEGTYVSQSDTTGILTSLGINSFFVGQDAGSIQVDQRIADDARNFASSGNGDISDTANLFNLIALQDERSLDNGRLSFGEYLNEISTDIGSRVQTDSQLSSSLNNLQLRYEQERNSVSGVDLNEELVKLQQFQTSYEAAVRVIQSTEQMLDDLFSVVG